jgi:hypothetical protein
MGLRQAAEGAAQVVELLLLVVADLGRGVLGDQAAVVGGAEALLGVVGDLLGAARPAELVDARVLGDLVDPRLERDRPVGVAHPPQGRHEDVLGDVLGAGVVVDHALDVARDPAVVAPVQALERTVVARTDARHELVVGDVVCVPGGRDGRSDQSPIPQSAPHIRAALPVSCPEL